MPKFDLDIPHALPPADVKTRLSEAITKLESKYGATCNWLDDSQLSVSRTGLDARVSIEPSRVHVHVNLGLLLTPMAGAIRSGLTKELTALLGPPAPATG
jgi:putative polyhydroxyalkanoate system protein